MARFVDVEGNFINPELVALVDEAETSMRELGWRSRIVLEGTTFYVKLTPKEVTELLSER